MDNAGKDSKEEEYSSENVSGDRADYFMNNYRAN
jgi:hypothetical protein